MSSSVKAMSGVLGLTDVCLESEFVGIANGNVNLNGNEFLR